MNVSTRESIIAHSEIIILPKGKGWVATSFVYDIDDNIEVYADTGQAAMDRIKLLFSAIEYYATEEF